MEPRERVLAALAGQEPDKVPKALCFYRVDLAAIAPPGYTEKNLDLEVRFVEFEPSRDEQRFHDYIWSIAQNRIVLYNIIVFIARDRYGRGGVS